ncbi:MAG: glycosyltransferase family 39 protein [Elusimicrobiota bacterium]
MRSPDDTPESSPPRGPKRDPAVHVAVGCLLALAGALFFARAWWFVTANSLPMDDQGVDLALSVQLRESGGWAGFLSGCVRGSYREANRHPLLPLLLSPWASRDPVFFDRARAAGMIMALLSWGLLFWTLARLEGKSTSLAALAWMAVIPSTARYAGLVGPESLLAAATAAGWLLLRSRRPAAGYAAGVCLGLGFMLKATGLLFAVACLLGAWLGGQSKRQLLRTATGFLLVASPLIIRNLVVFHLPFYNVNQHVLWLDTWWDYWPREWAGTVESVGVAEYASGHTVYQALLRWLKGLAAVGGVFAHIWSPRGLLGAALFLPLAAWGLWNDAHAARRRAATALLLACWAAFGWYAPVVLSDRFLYPLLPIAAYYAGQATLRLWERISGRAQSRGAIAAACLTALLLWNAAARDRAKPAWDLHSRGFREALRWMDGRFQDRTKVVMDTDDFLTWMLRSSPKKACLPVPPVELWRFAEWGKAEYVVLFHGSARPVGLDYRSAFGNEVATVFSRIPPSASRPEGAASSDMTRDEPVPADEGHVLYTTGPTPR